MIHSLIRKTLAVAGVASALLLGSSAHAQTILLDIAFTPVSGSGTALIQQDSSGAWWNTLMWNSTTAPFDRADLADTTNTLTGYTITSVNVPLGSGGQEGQDAPVAGLGLLAQADATDDYIFGSSDFSFILGGLDAGSTYNITVFGARASGSRSTIYQVSGGNGPFSYDEQVSTSGTPNGSATLLDLAIFNGVTPDGSNNITFDVMTGTGGFAYLNAIQIDVVPIPEPSAAIMLGGMTLLGWVARRRRTHCG